MRYTVFVPPGTLPNVMAGPLPGGPLESVGLIDAVGDLEEAEMLAADVPGAKIWDEVESRVVER